MSKIQKELAQATGKAPEKGQSIKDDDYIKDLVRGVAKLTDDEWDKLSTDAQKWYNATADSVKQGKGVLPFPDAEAAKPEEGSRRRRADPDDAKDTPRPEKGAKVVVVTSKGTEYRGKVVVVDDDGFLVLDDGGKDELSVKWANIKEWKEDKPAKVAEPEEGARRRRRSEEDDEPPAKAEPAVGDTVEVTTKRGTVKMGNVIELKPGVLIAIKDAAGDEYEYEHDRIESIAIKVRAAAGGRGDEGSKRRRGADEDESDSGRRRSSKTEDKNGDKDDDTKRDMGIGEKARLLIIRNRSWTKDEFLKHALKEFPGAKENTLKLIYGDAHRLIGMLKAEGAMK